MVQIVFFKEMELKILMDVEEYITNPVKYLRHEDIELFPFLL